MLALFVADELCLIVALFCSLILTETFTTLGQVDDRQEELDRVTATNRVLSNVKVLYEVLELVLLDEVHAFTVKLLNGAVDNLFVFVPMSVMVP